MRALEPDAWLADFRQVLAAMSAHYANLDSAIDDRGLDLPALKKRTEERLRAAKSEEDARAALNEFMTSFGDGHARIVWTPPSQSGGSAAALQKACEGYQEREARGIDFTRVAGYQPLGGADATQFPGGLLPLDAKRKAGVLRIRLFSEHAHPELCTAATVSLGIAQDAQCEFRSCGYPVQLAGGNLLSAALARRVEALRSAGATSIIVDLTGNGGGSNWVEPAVRILSPVPLQSPRLAYVKHPHWVKQLQERLDDVRYDLEHEGQPKTLLLDAERKLRDAVAKAGESCDRMSVWSDPPKRPQCSLLVKDMLFASGVLAHAKPGAIPTSLRSHGVLFDATNYLYRESVNRLPLIVLVDENTASAAEQAVAMLQDGNAATIAGIPTRGSGCGHTNGGIDVTLNTLGGVLKLPDCARLRKDGANEVTGIIPDLLVPWSRFDSRYQRAVKLYSILRSRR